MVLSNRSSVTVSSVGSRPFIRVVRRSRRARRVDPDPPGPLAARLDRNGGLLVLVRHGESEFNKQDRFTGLMNPDLTPKGVEDAINVGRTLRRLKFRCDTAFTSKLKRAGHSLRLILKELGTPGVPVREENSLNERDYGELAGLTRDAACTRWGETQVKLWRRSYDAVPPGGESLQMTLRRTQPLYDSSIKPLLIKGRNVLVVAHGNSMRSIVMTLDHLSADEVMNVSFPTGTVLIYWLNPVGEIVQRLEIPVAAQT